MAEPLDRMASWPRHLKASWRDCAERGDVDAHNPPTSMLEAYLQVAEDACGGWRAFLGVMGPSMTLRTMRRSY